MDADIRAAAGYLERAVAHMQSRINELQGEELRGRRELDSESSHLSSDIRQTELQLALASSSNDTESGSKMVELTKEIYELRKNRDQLKNNTSRHLSEEEREVRSLQDQMNRLQQIVHALEAWS